MDETIIGIILVVSLVVIVAIWSWLGEREGQSLRDLINIMFLKHKKKNN